VVPFANTTTFERSPAAPARACDELGIQLRRIGPHPSHPAVLEGSCTTSADRLLRPRQASAGNHSRCRRTYERDTNHARRPARSPTGTPTQPAAGAPDGTRIAADSAASGRRDGLVGRCRRDPSPRQHRGDSGERSSSRSSVSLPQPDRSPCATPPSSCFQKTGDDLAIKANFTPLAQRRIPEIAENFAPAEIPGKSGDLRANIENVPHFRSFPDYACRRSSSVRRVAAVGRRL
jgi:hypothetical protein